MRSTSTDVAKRAGVSRATVSYVLNDARGQTISAQTREAVLRAARELNYRPHAGARSLRSGRSDVVLFPLPGLDMAHVWGKPLDACAVALRERRFTLVTDFTPYGSSDDQIDSWLRLRPAIVIDVILRRNDPVHDALRNSGVAVLTAARTPGPATQRPFDTISDSARAIQVEHLLAGGAREIVFAVPAAARSAFFGRGRQTEMHKLIRKAGAKLEFEDVELERDSLAGAAVRWRRSRPDAVCAYNDELAIGLLSALADEGIRVPDDLAVIGLDDIPLASAVTPTLTSVTFDVEELGRAIADAAAKLMASDDLTAEFSVPSYRVVQRESA